MVFLNIYIIYVYTINEQNIFHIPKMFGLLIKLDCLYCLCIDYVEYIAKTCPTIKLLCN